MSHVDDGTLHAYLDGELSPPEAQAVEAHAAQCPACRTRLEEERALIARAGELLARAAPPDRELPPFRPGDVKPPVRLWWHVRTPVAWAATIALALGIGTYVGEHGVARFGPTAPQHPATLADRVARNAPEPSPAAAPTVDSASALARRGRVSKRAASPAAGVVAEEKSRQDSFENFQSNALAARESQRIVGEAQRMAAKAAAPAPAPAHPGMLQLRSYSGAVKGPPISVDSARKLLGTDPMAVPELPVRGIYAARMIGYSRMVIVEQTLDSSTIIEVISGHALPLALSEVVVTGAGVTRADSQSAGARALLNARPADSLAAASPPTPTPAVDQEKAKPGESGLSVDVRGPLSPDSLTALKRLLRPLRP